VLYAAATAIKVTWHFKSLVSLSLFVPHSSLATATPSVGLIVFFFFF
jgi:hypothetical protein